MQVLFTKNNDALDSASLLYQLLHEDEFNALLIERSFSFGRAFDGKLLFGVSTFGVRVPRPR